MDKEIVNYVIIEDFDQSFLARKVTEYIAKGWVPSGGVAVSININKKEEHEILECLYAQAMIKYKS